MNPILLAGILALSCTQALAAVSQQLPEPDSFALLAVAGVAAAIVAFRKRRK